MNAIEEALDDIVNDVSGLVDEADVNHLLQDGMPVRMIQVVRSGPDRSTRLEEDIQQSMSRQSIDAMSIKHVLMRLKTSSSHPLLVRELVTLTDTFMGNRKAQTDHFKYLTTEDPLLGDQLQVLILIWAANQE